jgi:FkbM family methyltransferase
MNELGKDGSPASPSHEARKESEVVQDPAEAQRREDASRALEGTHGRRASTYLARARKRRAGNAWEPDHQADFLLASASILATLDVAQAIRETTGSYAPEKQDERDQRDAFFTAAAEHTRYVGVETIDGVQFVVATWDRAVGRRLFVGRRRSETKALAWVAGLIPTDGWIVDVGANIGTTCVTALAAHGFSEALAIEPVEENVALLRANAALNGVHSRLRVAQTAAGAKAGEAMLRLDATNSGGHRLTSAPDALTVPVETVDRLLDQHDVDPAKVALLWLDTQGYEPHVLRGASRLLGQVPTVIEVAPSLLGGEGLSLLHLTEGYRRVLSCRTREATTVEAALAHDGVSDLLLLP